jgi:CubicO group peptidase (beta-lactamase class C family)
MGPNMSLKDPEYFHGIVSKAFEQKQFVIHSVLFVLMLLPIYGCGGTESRYKDWLQEASPELMGMDSTKLEEARDYSGGSGYIIRGGKLVLSWGSATKLYDLKSASKSIGITAVGLAIKDGKMHLDDKANKANLYLSNIGIPPKENRVTGLLDDITLLHLATHTAGFDKSGGYSSLLFSPGAAWAYSDGGANWLADCITAAYGQDLRNLMFSRVLTPLGIRSSDLIWRNNSYREETINGSKRREFGSGMSANIDAMARIGYLYLRGGRWKGAQIIPRSFVDMVRMPVPEVVGLPVVNDENSRFADASNHYGLLWWNNADGVLRKVPNDAFWSWGFNDSLIVIIPSLDIVAVRAGAPWSGERSPNYYRIIKPFLETIAASVNHGAPYPNSTAISALVWDDSSNIIRKALGSDNWPITWGDDDNLYTAYGDGWGFEPKVPEKLSLGFTRIVGIPPNFSGMNIRSSAEEYGNGRSGKKAAGMLMVDGVLYMWVRNANNNGEHCQLAWSFDKAEKWNWANWKFEQFGYCTFVNFGKDYHATRDSYVYTFTHDNPSAYKRADRFVLIRVARNQIINRDAYEFLQHLDSRGNPTWTSNVALRGAVFTEEGRCHRSGISYNSKLGRYIWWQAKYDDQVSARHQGGFGIFDAPEPWGPWTTVFYVDQGKWDVGGGETGSFPSKWMSADGMTMHLVFSGNDSFSVRKATLILPPILQSPILSTN